MPLWVFLVSIIGMLVALWAIIFIIDWGTQPGRFIDRAWDWQFKLAEKHGSMAAVGIASSVILVVLMTIVGTIVYATSGGRVMSTTPYHTGDHARPIHDVDVSASARRIIVPAGTTGRVIEDLNEVVARQNARDRYPPSTRLETLALVRWDDYDAQAWMRYHEIERAP